MRDNRLLAPLLLIALVLAVFSPLAKSGFVQWDDFETIALNPSFHPPTVESIAHYWQAPYMDLYVPLTYTMWGSLAALSPSLPPDELGITLNPAVFHLANVVLHACSTLIVLQILRRMTARELPTLAGAALFAVHPVQVEPVAWISGGKDVLSGCLALLAIWQYVVFAQMGLESDADRRSSRRAYLISITAYVLAMLAKPSAVAVPLVAGVLDGLLIRRDRRAVGRSLTPYLLLALPVLVVGKLFQQAPDVVSPLLFRPIVAADALAWYLGKLIWPVRLAVDYGRSPVWLLNSPQRYWTWIVPAIGMIACVKLARRGVRGPAATMGAFVAAVLPVLGLVQFDFQTRSTVADHYLYLAMLGVALAVGFVLKSLPVSPRATRIATLASALVVGLLGVLSFRQCFAWRNTSAFLEHTRAVNPTSIVASSGLGHYWVQRGDDLRAAVYYDQACREHPNDSTAHFNYANLLRRIGRIEQALYHYARAVELKPDRPQHLLNFGLALLQIGQPAAALEQFQRVIAVDPDNADAWQNAGLVLRDLGQPEQARQAFREVLRIDPTRSVARENLQKLSPATAPVP